MIRRLRGHVLTVAPTLRHQVWPYREPPGRDFAIEVADPRCGAVTLTGRLHERPGAESAVIVVHGLGGSRESFYTILAARAALARGHSVLRLDLRGAGGSGAGLYHAGLTDDIHAALASDDLAGYRRLLLLGYSLGGHMCLRAATEDCDSRLASVAAIHAPLDLAAACTAIDRPRALVYRLYLLRQLQIHYRALHRRHGGPIAPRAADRIREMRTWDDRIVAPLFGFAGAGDYYRQAAVASRLTDLRVPALLVVEARDPIVPRSVIAPFVPTSGSQLTVRWTDSGGHVGYPDAEAMEQQCIDWLAGN